MKKNQVKNNLLEELVNLVEQDSSGVEGHSGTKGQDIDQLFSGPFKPDINNLENTLKDMLSTYKKLSKWNNENTPNLEMIYRLIPDFEKKIKDAITAYGNPYRDTEIKYDKVIKMTDDEVNNFKNDTNQFQPVSSFNKFV